MNPRDVLGRALRRVAPGTLARLDDVTRLRQEVDRLNATAADQQSRNLELDDRVAAAARDIAAVDETLQDARRRGGLADDAIARLVEQVEGLHGRLDEVAADLQESRRLSLRVAQLADLVFDRLVAADPAPDGDVTTAPTDR
ncbi:DUF6752 domain-containing protein [Blastococcus sp. TBT05-19]|uniref:DUF6752 domain-containing protein n=1 Tax=Blastococcus sp. TBT05-19 TaxID=2250581 RepID=UPI0011BF638E|nr:DUF6752 domain-containing protein [Blastococcus sp. TBT05-19]